MDLFLCLSFIINFVCWSCKISFFTSWFTNCRESLQEHFGACGEYTTESNLCPVFGLKKCVICLVSENYVEHLCSLRSCAKKVFTGVSCFASFSKWIIN